uniref:Uncharacterized protein n=1 Tax=Anopheles minimus TaxID=112268 RepID=A0A182W5C1_9DIPT
MEILATVRLNERIRQTEGWKTNSLGERTTQSSKDASKPQHAASDSIGVTLARGRSMEGTRKQCFVKI